MLRLLETLTTPHSVDRYLELLDPMLSVRQMRARVTAVRHSTVDSVTLRLRPTRHWQGFDAGQFVTVGVVVDGVRHTRCYSPASSAHDAREFELTVRAQGLVSRHLKQRAEVGTVLDLAPAAGEFRLPTPRPRRLVLISGGSGITPVLSMLRTLAEEDYDGEVVFLHYAKRPEAVPHRADLDALAERGNVRIVFGYTETDDGDVHGRFTAEHLAAVAPWFAGAQTYLCGPSTLMRAVREHYADAGIESRLHIEEFTPALAPITDVGGTVHFASSGLSRESCGASLLEQAEAAGSASRTRLPDGNLLLLHHHQDVGSRP